MLLLWSGTPTDIRMLAAQLSLLVLVGAGMAIVILVNLLANANRYTQTGTRITITGRVMARDVLLTVHDNGPGIPTEELDKIFQRFYRVSREQGGSGLGLAIAKAVVERHGGRMWAESQAGAGAVFRIALPRTMHGEER